MKLKEFDVETWMTDYELDCKYNLTETCVASLSLNDLKRLSGKELEHDVFSMIMDYGPIVGSDELKKAILSLYKTKNLDDVTITHGAINGNELVLMTLLEPNDHVISLFPTYQQMYDFPESLGCDVSFVYLREESNWECHIDDFQKVLKPNTKMICLNSPNNPTGTTFKEDMIIQICEFAKEHDLYILCDEIYRGLDHKTQLLMPSFADYYDKAIVTQSLSKVYSFAGLRLGWIIANEDIIRDINLRRDYHIISSGPLNDYLGTVVLNLKDDILKRSDEITSKGKELLKQWLINEPHFSCVIPEYGTVGFLKYDFDIPSAQFCIKLQKETGIFFVPGSCFGIENHVRFGFTHSDHIEKALPILSEWAKQFD